MPYKLPQWKFFETVPDEETLKRGPNILDFIPLIWRDNLVYTAEHLPPGLHLDPKTGVISGAIEYSDEGESE